MASSSKALQYERKQQLLSPIMSLKITHGYFLLGPPLAYWFAKVKREVPEPYLDEVFHVPQAQKYCDGDFSAWDDKITTPPGLYVVTYLLKPILGCDTSGTRATNLVCMVALAWIVEKIFSRRIARPEDDKHGSWLAQHSSLNIALFPPLFFFSALYYTDVTSALSVMLCYYQLICSDKKSISHWWWRLQYVALGLCSLLFRQTNIFWVAIFPAAMMFLREVDQGHQVVKGSMYRKVEGFGDTFQSVAKTSWKMEVLYDPPVRDASFEDFMKCLLSLVACTLKVVTKPRRTIEVLTTLLPFLILLASFAGFILFNGSVVLGDKTNHVATIHTPQLLYLWPVICFFSWPFAYQHLIRIPLVFLALLPGISSLEQLLVFKRRPMLPRLVVLVCFGGLAFASVRWNTIIHPFTLADNRHYVFYVFRQLQRAWWIPYAVLPIYVTCAWLSIQALGSAPQSRTAPAGPPSPQSSEDDVGKHSRRRMHERLLPLPDTTQSAGTSFLIIWLATTALNLVTAPLVEPRYFIIPWIFFRLHLPLSHPTATQDQNDKDRKREEVGEDERGLWKELYRTMWEKHDNRLWLETLWFVTVNGMTGYMFLYKGFEWKQEPGKIQRFMW